MLDPGFAYSFVKIAAFRNFLAHDYDKVDAEAICGDILESLSDVRTYISQISQSCGIDIVK